MSDLEDILTYCEAATKRPWVVEGGGGIHMDGTRDWYRVYELQRAIIHPLSYPDANFIARAHSDLPRVTTELIAARKRIADLEESRDSWRDSAYAMEVRVLSERAGGYGDGHQAGKADRAYIEEQLEQARRVVEAGRDFKSAVVSFLQHLGYWAKENEVEIPSDFLVETYLRVASLALNTALADYERERGKG